MADVEAPSAGAPTTAATPPTPSGSPAGLTDDQIIDQAVEEYEKGQKAKTADDSSETLKEAPEEEAPESKEKEAKEAEKPEAKAKDEELEDHLRESEIPESWKDTLKQIKGLNPKVAKQIRDEHFEITEYRRLMPVEQVREIRGLFSNLDEAQGARRAMADVTAINSAMREDPPKLLSTLANLNPESFPKLVETFPVWLYKSDPETFVETLGRPITGHFLSQVASYGKRIGSDVSDDAVAIVRELADAMEKEDRGSHGESDPWKRRAEEAEQELYRRESQSLQQQVGQFVGDVRDEAARLVRGDITKTFERIKVPGIPEDAKAEMQTRVLNQVAQKVMADPLIRQMVQASARDGTRDREHLKQVVSHVLARAKPFIPDEVQEALKWYRRLTGGPRPVARDEKEVASQRELGHGAPVGTGGSPKKWTQMSDKEKKSMSADDIFEAAMKGAI